MGIFDKAGGLFKKGGSELQHLINEAKHEINVAKDAAIASLKNEERNISRNIENQSGRAVEKIKNETNTTIEKINHEFDNLNLKEVIDEEIKEFITYLTSETFKKIIKKIEIVTPLDITLSIGPADLTFEEPAKKVKQLLKLSENPPATKKEVKQTIIDLSPNKVSLSVSVQLALLVVSSSSLEVGVSASWTPEQFVKNYEELFDW